MTPLRSLYIAIVLSFIGIAQAQQPSGTPQCTQSCPPHDVVGYNLGTASIYHYSSGGVLFCSYPSSEGDDANVYYCTYNSSTGEIITAHDISGCPPTAVESCSISRRFKGDDNYTAMLRKKREAAAAQPRSSESRARARKPSVSL
ncbi:hypothetical protein C8R45DRAFT_1168400 [Mycena sanguinolenta]|nr:hypothetical protein C8R45DRAFT_1168400 [Mycena sanguinolenta]